MHASLPNTEWAGHAPCRPSAAAGSPLASVLMLLKSAATAEKACACMATLAFLLLDRSNRKAVSELDCVGAVLEAIRSYPDPQVHLVALDTIVAVVKHDNTEKVWWRGAMWRPATISQ